MEGKGQAGRKVVKHTSNYSVIEGLNPATGSRTEETDEHYKVRLVSVLI